MSWNSGPLPAETDPMRGDKASAESSTESRLHCIAIYATTTTLHCSEFAVMPQFSEQPTADLTS